MTSLAVRVKPKSSRSEILGIKAGVWQVALCSPPTEGKANAELLQLLAKTLRIAPSCLEISRGHKSRDKTVQIHGLEPVEILARLSSQLTP
jgi:uncharacterized protein (TIGR00251 family)